MGPECVWLVLRNLFPHAFAPRILGECLLYAGCFCRQWVTWMNETDGVPVLIMLTFWRERQPTGKSGKGSSRKHSKE